MRLPVTPRERKNSLFCDVDCGFTVMLLGDSCTGKTCILIRFKDNTFMNNNFISTVGIDYRNKVLELGRRRVWDTAGQERFRSLTASYYRDADALLLIYDVTNRASFEHIRDWLAQVKEYAKDEVALTLVGNKVDLGHQRKVRADEGRQLAKDYDIPFIETSAKSGQNVSEMFFDLTTRLLNAVEANKEGENDEKERKASVLELSAEINGRHGDGNYWRFTSCCGGGKA